MGSGRYVNSYNEFKIAKKILPLGNGSSSPFGTVSNPSYSATNKSSPFGIAPKRNLNQTNDRNNVNRIGTNSNTQNQPRIKYHIKPKQKNKNKNGVNSNQNLSLPQQSSQKPKYSHKWGLGIRYKPQIDSIYLDVTDSVYPNKLWRKIITSDDIVYEDDLKQEYFFLNKMVHHGKAKYTFPNKDGGNVQAAIIKGDDSYVF